MPTACWGTNKLTEVAWVSFGYGSRWDLQRDVKVSLEALHTMARFDYDWRDDVVYGYYREEPQTYKFFKMPQEEKEEEIKRILSLLSPREIHKYSPLWFQFPHLNLNQKQTDEKAAEWLMDIFNSDSPFKYNHPPFHHCWLDYKDTLKDKNGIVYPKHIYTPIGVPKGFPDSHIMQRIEDMMKITECHHFNTLTYKRFRERNKDTFCTFEDLNEIFEDDWEED